MKIKRYLVILFVLIYLELIFNLFAYGTILKDSIVNIILFCFVNSFIIYFITGLFREKINKIVSYIVFSFMGFWYSLYYIFYKVFITPFSIALFRQSDQTLKFGKNIILSILQNLHVVILLFLPLVFLIIFNKKINLKKITLKNFVIYFCIFIISISVYLFNIFIQRKNTGSIYNLIFETNNVSLNIQKLGVPFTTYLDIYRTIFGFSEKIVIEEELEPVEEEVIEYNDNKLELNFEGGDGDIYTINKYMSNDSGTKQNEYTGMFKNKNLVFIVAESFSEIAVSKDLTPTLYKLIHNGFDFENFYTSNNLSTIGGEFQAITGLYADNTILSKWRSGTGNYPYGLANVFKNLGYNTFAYHNNSAYFQDRNVYLKSQGFENFKGCYNGLEKSINCERWPQSDIEMIDATIPDYINSDSPFLAYYMTVSGHFYYDYSNNSIARKNKDLVDHLDYPEDVKGYLATQIELDRALEHLVSKLEEAQKLDDTVIVLVADHYPYNLPIEYINMLSTYERDSLIEANSNNLIIYNSKIKNTKIDKVGMSIDIIPTVYNLFGIDYDSRLIIGKDILSTSDGIAIFKDKSWVTNYGTYYASTSEFVANSNVPEGYVERINNIVNNRVAISRMIVSNDYYKYIFNGSMSSSVGGTKN